MRFAYGRGFTPGDVQDPRVRRNRIIDRRPHLLCQGCEPGSVCLPCLDLRGHQQDWGYVNRSLARSGRSRIRRWGRTEEKATSKQGTSMFDTVMEADGGYSSLAWGGESQSHDCNAEKTVKDGKRSATGHIPAHHAWSEVKPTLASTRSVSSHPLNSLLSFLLASTCLSKRN